MNRRAGVKTNSNVNCWSFRFNVRDKNKGELTQINMTVHCSQVSLSGINKSCEASTTAGKKTPRQAELPVSSLIPHTHNQAKPKNTEAILVDVNPSFLCIAIR